MTDGPAQDGTITIVRYEQTPNPDAVKCVLDGVVSDRPRSFVSADDAAGDPIAGPVFATGRVRAVLINGDWCSVNRKPGEPWAPIKRALADALAGLGASGS